MNKDWGKGLKRFPRWVSIWLWGIVCNCLYFSWSFPPIFPSPIKLPLSPLTSFLTLAFPFLSHISLIVIRTSKHFCRCLAAGRVQPTTLLHSENVFIVCLSSLRHLPVSLTVAESNCRTALGESSISPLAALPPTLCHSLQKGSLQAVFALQFTSPTTGRQLQYISGKETSPKCQAEWRIQCAVDRKILMAKVTLHCWRHRFFHPYAIAFLAEAENFTWIVLYLGTP